MKDRLDMSTLCKQWVHSREEDTSTETVYRPVDYPFPPSRGRSALVFHTDGRLKRIGIGSTDISSVREGTWRIVEPGSVLIQMQVNDAKEEVTVQSLDEGRLVICGKTKT